MLDSWLARSRAEAGLSVSPLAWSENREWGLREGRLQHHTGRYFSVCGVAVHGPAPDAPVRFMPMIEQPEIGQLAFLVWPGPDGPQWLLQAKAEPGSIGHVQIGPTVQATLSNYGRVHGGEPTAYLDQVLDREDGCVTRLLQSEQGSRFMGKFNMNVVRRVPERIEPARPEWFWADARALRQALAGSFVVNTDARSVIASTDWSLLCADGQPFAPRGDRWDGLRSELSLSLHRGARSTRPVLDAIQARRGGQGFRLVTCPLDALPGWRCADQAITAIDDGADFEVCSVAVSAPRRECPAWHQPLLRSTRLQACRLFLTRRDDVMCAFLAYSDEPGFGTACELGPSWQSDRLNPEWVTAWAGSDGVTVWASIDQSDEGGRFLDSVMRYEICELDSADVEADALAGQGGHWVSLAQLQALCATGGVLTNEARSLVSLLLSLA
jgi:oxidase EvaA